MSSENAIKINDIRITCSAHATEDIAKVKEAMLFFLPEKLRKTQEINDIELEGHAGNLIHLLEIEIKQKRKVLEVVQYLSTIFDETDKEFIYDDLDSCFGDNNCLFLRFNKQDAFNSQLTFEEKDNTIKLVIKFVIYQQKPGLVESTLEKYGLIKKS